MVGVVVPEEVKLLNVCVVFSGLSGVRRMEFGGSGRGSEGGGVSGQGWTPESSDAEAIRDAMSLSSSELGVSKFANAKSNVNKDNND